MKNKKWIVWGVVVIVVMVVVVVLLRKKKAASQMAIEQTEEATGKDSRSRQGFVPAEAQSTVEKVSGGSNTGANRVTARPAGPRTAIIPPAKTGRSRQVIPPAKTQRQRG